MVAKGLLGLAAAGYVYGRYVEPNWVEIVRHELPIADLPAALDGFKIVQLSDFHLWPHTQVGLVERVVQMTNRLKPDLVALTGDYGCKDKTAIFALARPLAKLQATFGTVAIVGNHDVSRRFPETRLMMRDGLAAVGIRLLVNERLELANGLVIAGLDEMYSGRPNLAGTLGGVSAETPVILLMHQPDYADRACQDPRIKVQLSGHTHGGQFRIPFIRPLYLPWFGEKYVIGLYKVDNLWLNVNRGIGLAYMGPMRFRCRPEISEIVLRREPTG